MEASSRGEKLTEEACESRGRRCRNTTSDLLQAALSLGPLVLL